MAEFAFALLGIAIGFFVIGFCAGAIFFRWLFKDDDGAPFDPEDDPPSRGWTGEKAS
jgi:hypothetical protein